MVMSDGPLGNQGAAHLQKWRDDQVKMFNQLNIAWFDCCNDGNHIDSVLRFVRRYF